MSTFWFLHFLTSLICFKPPVWQKQICAERNPPCNMDHAPSASAVCNTLHGINGPHRPLKGTNCLQTSSASHQQWLQQSFQLNMTVETAVHYYSE